jgi:AcrR family transcriptional regulator
MKHNNETEKKILKAALGLFVRKGFHGTSIDDVMSKVGMTKGAFYSHFQSKGDLFLRLIEEFRIRFFDEIVSNINEFEGNALEKIHRIFGLLAKFASENTDLCVFLTFLTTEMNADVDFEPVLRRVYIDYQNFISVLIKQGIREGVFKKELNPDLAALTFMALHDGTLHQWVLNRQYIDGEEYVRTFCDIFVSGLADKDPQNK